MVRLILLLIILVGPHAIADVLEQYVELATGTFSSASQAATDSRYDAVTWHIAEVWPGRDDEARWLYTENWIDGTPAPYMQRISRVSLQDDGSLIAKRFLLPEEADLIGAWEDVERFEQIDAAALRPIEGCDGIIVRAGVSRFEGGTVGRRCGSTYKGASYAISQSTITADGRVNWDRGFTDDGVLVWGPAAGGYRFERVTGEESCNKPVRMLVYGEITDREKFFAYVRAIGESGLYEETGGFYEGITPPLAVFEGEPPPTRGVVISRFPCLQAAKDFWYSDKYELIRPLRQGISEFEVLVLPSPPIPGWVSD